MTAEQQQTILDTLWIGDNALRRQKRAYDEDLRQVAIIYLCKCLLRYNADLGVKWNTYAYKSVDLYIRREIEKEKKMRNREIISAREYVIGERINKERALYLEIKENCTPRTQKVLELKLQGYNDREVRDIVHCANKKLCEMKREIKEIAREIKNDH